MFSDFSKKKLSGGYIGTFDTWGGGGIFGIGNLNEFVLKIKTSHLSVVLYMHVHVYRFTNYELKTYH